MTPPLADSAVRSGRSSEESTLSGVLVRLPAGFLSTSNVGDTSAAGGTIPPSMHSSDPLGANPTPALEPPGVFHHFHIAGGTYARVRARVQRGAEWFGSNLLDIGSPREMNHLTGCDGRITNFEC